MASAANHSSGRTILVVDDEEDIRDLYQLVLEKLGHKVLLAGAGDAAAECYRQSLKNDNPIDIVILDLNLQDGPDGKEIASVLRNLDPHARLIVSSGDATAPEMTRYAEYGFNGALEKTFNRENIQHILEQVLASD